MGSLNHVYFSRIDDDEFHALFGVSRGDVKPLLDALARLYDEMIDTRRPPNAGG